MKRIVLAFLFFVAGNAFAANLGPYALQASTTIPAAGAGLINYLTHVSAVSGSTYTFRILDGGTTVYELRNLAANTAIVLEWSDLRYLILTANTSTDIKVDNGTLNINYMGFTR